MIAKIIIFLTVWFALDVVLGMMVGRVIRVCAGGANPMPVLAMTKPSPPRWQSTARRAA